MADLLLGKPVLEDIKAQLLSANLQKKVVTIGFEGDAQWLQYTNALKKNSPAFGVEVDNVLLDEREDIVNTIEKYNKDDSVGGIMVQQPLPKKVANAVESIAFEKDLDCLSSKAVNALYRNQPNAVCSATPQAVLELLNYYNISVAGKNVVIVGRGYAVGRPLALLLINNNATVTVCHTKTRDLSSVCKTADILISCCGVPNMINQNHVKAGMIVIDVGLSFVDGKTCGDVDKQAIEDIVQAYSPVPGGVGPVTRGCIFKNLQKLITK